MAHAPDETGKPQCSPPSAAYFPETAFFRLGCGLHDRLNTELPEQFGEVASEYDGDAYRFHLTIVSGGANKETYHALCADCVENPPSFAFASFPVREIALFVYSEPTPGEWEYLTHTILPLSGDAEASPSATKEA